MLDLEEFKVGTVLALSFYTVKERLNVAGTRAWKLVTSGGTADMYSYRRNVTSGSKRIVPAIARRGKPAIEEAAKLGIKNI